MARFGPFTGEVIREGNGYVLVMTEDGYVHDLHRNEVVLMNDPIDTKNFCCEDLEGAFRRWDYTFYNPLIQSDDGGVKRGGPALVVFPALRSGNLTQVGKAYIYLVYCPFCGKRLRPMRAKEESEDEKDRTPCVDRSPTDAGGTNGQGG